jgi:hypothetical protein
MKKYLLVFMLITSLSSYTQQVTSDSVVEQFCILRVAYSLDLSGRISIDVDYGQERKWGKIYQLKDDETGKIRKFNSITDALNFLGRLGWKLVIAVPVFADKTSSTDYIFKKEIKIEEPSN